MKAVVMNLEEDNVGAVLLGPTNLIREGDTVKCTGKISSIPAALQYYAPFAGAAVGEVPKAGIEVNFDHMEGFKSFEKVSFKRCTCK